MADLSGRAAFGVMRAVNESMAAKRNSRSMRDLASASDDVLRALACHLDLPMDDSESVDFLRQAFKAAAAPAPGKGGEA